MSKILQKLHLPDESQGNDVVWVDSYKPVAVFAVRVGVRVVRGENESRKACHIPTTRGYRIKWETN